MTKTKQFAGKSAKDAIDESGFENLIDTVAKFTAAVDRKLRGTAHKVTLQEWSALRSLNEAEGTEGSSRSPGKSVAAKLVKKGLVTREEDGPLSLTDEGKAALAEFSTLTKTIIAELEKEECGKISATTARPLARATRAIRKLTTEKKEEAVEA
ncbi:hypothetical protein RGQ15_10640 [Paracoccus sp. MBLB3053]|uniref:MarR family transcriptional regulator n=1 Tax=Paracoccus aurantius TaxID=3073814 RepID=A0ABU2HSK6_9RHOB|nr:hypothetical protein [Paracoccus sp. MBLB3053]MDS9468022.1 hypothetical protein [Paracoccus sp. MBLB3053]